jgi:antitoxin component HigA of HigAB toxin-antitoxin module
MKTVSRPPFIAPKFAGLPKDYTGLCLLLLPRPIHNRGQAADAEAMIDALAVDENRLSADQGDYLAMLSDVLEAWDEAQTPKGKTLSGAAFLALLIEQSGQSAASVAREIGVDRSVMTRLLSGERAFTVSQAQALGKHFAVDPAALLGLV